MTKKWNLICLILYTILLLVINDSIFRIVFILSFILYALINIIFKNELKDKNTIANGFMIAASIAYLIFLIVVSGLIISLPTLLGALVGTAFIRLLFW